MAFITNPRRDASPTIAGFVFQVNLTILRWLELREDEHLDLECGEDIDSVQSGLGGDTAAETRLLEQIKARSTGSVTLKSKDALQALANFCAHRAANPNLQLKFRYVTTAKIGVEQGWGRSETGIETWTALQRGRFDEATRVEAIPALRTLLKSATRPEKVSDEAWEALQVVLAADDDAKLIEMIHAFEWGTGYEDFAETENTILQAIGRNEKITPICANEVYEHLFAFVFRLLCQRGKKLLTSEQRETELRVPSAAEADHRLMRLVRNELSQMDRRLAAVERAMTHQVSEVTTLRHAIELVGENLGFDSNFALGATSLSTDPPDLVDPCATRQVLVNHLLARVQTNGTVALTGEPGCGKTQLLLLVSRKSGHRRFWLNIPRTGTEEQACILLKNLLRLATRERHNLPFRESCIAAEQFRSAIVVIEDLPRVIPGGPLATHIVILSRCLKRVGACLLMSSYFRLPATTEQKLGEVHCDVPRFGSEDVAELLAAAGAPNVLRTEKVCDLLVGVSEGLPVLVMSAVRYLADREWNFRTAELESLFRGEFASALRRDATDLLQVTVPDAEERELLIRLSLAVGDFSIEDIASVARIRKEIALPGEKVRRMTGLWLQKVGKERYLRSPLITSSLAESLDPETRKDVHYVLARRILARKSLDPLEVFACVGHLLMAEAMNLAVIVVIQVLAMLIEQDGRAEDDFGFARMWSSGQFPAGVDIDLQICLRALQVVVLAKQSRDIQPYVTALDALIGEVGGAGWGVAVATAGLAVHLAMQLPVLANKYLLHALASIADARLPDGSALPHGDYPLETTLWVSSYGCKSDAEIDSWLETLSRFTPAQIENLKSSELMEDNVTILCDGIWLREYVKPEAERDWNSVKRKLEQVEATARVVGFPLLEAAALRARIMLLAEWEKQVEAAVSLAESSLKRLEGDECHFLIMEATGRQLCYAGKSKEAIAWLTRAIACDAYRNSLWRRNVLIIMAELHGPTDPRRATEFTGKAVRVCEDGKLQDTIYIEALAEHGIALWRAGESLQSFRMFEKSIERMLAIRTDTDDWKGRFARLFAVIAYFSGIALKGKPQAGHVEPVQDLFLSSNDQAQAAYRPEQPAYIGIRLAMFAEGLRETAKAAEWAWKAIESARQIRAAWDTVRMLGWLAMAATLLVDNFIRAAELAALMMKTDIESFSSMLRTATDAAAAERVSEFEAAVDSAQSGAVTSGLLIIPFVPIAIRLAFHHFRGESAPVIVSALVDIESVIPVDRQPEGLCAEIRRALIDETDWRTLRDEGFRAIQTNEHVRGFVLCIGAMDKAPAAQSLYMQTYLAQEFDKLSKTYVSIYRELVAPFFLAYWARTVAMPTALFRTSLTYTQKQLRVVDGSADGTRRLLSAMRFCLGVTLPKETQEWLDSST